MVSINSAVDLSLLTLNLQINRSFGERTKRADTGWRRNETDEMKWTGMILLLFSFSLSLNGFARILCPPPRRFGLHLCHSSL
jgi:hypothetical protein